LKLNQFLAKIDSWSCSSLLILFYVFMVSGYMITKGLIDRYWGFVLHTELDLPIVAVFSVHFATRLRFFMIRRKLTKGFVLDMITLLAGLLSFIFVVYLDVFFRLA